MISNSYSPALLALADGTVFEGLSFGATLTTTGEIVFNTSMTGYQEILTDPSYCGQFVTMTCPQIGNVGINPEDMEASKPWVAGMIVREISRKVSNWRASQSLPEYMQSHNLPGITELDTRALVRHIRTKGAMMAAICTDGSHTAESLVTLAQKAPSMEGRDLVQKVTCLEFYHWSDGVPREWQTTANQTEPRYHVVAYDFGIKHNILRLLVDAGCHVTVVPATTPAEEVLALNPDGVFLSNGPGDPAAVTYAINTTRQLTETDLPMFGICLGHQILGLALGGSTHKMKFGHRGGNQPVKDVVSTEEEGLVTITSHNHGFAISPGSLPDGIEVTHLNLNDQCVEGLRHTKKPIFSIQYHPEASPGPHDALNFFDDFVALMAKNKA